MSYLLGTMMGIMGIASFIQANDKLQEKYYCLMANTKDIWKINIVDTSTLNYKAWRFPLFTRLTKYTRQQKIHYFGSITMFIAGNALSVHLYLNNKSKLHIDNSQLMYLPFDLFWCLFMNSTFFYIYHRLAHTKYLYKYIHSYHHAFRSPELYDSLIGHPLDHTCSAICQVLPMFVYRMHLLTFFLYSSILSMMGIYDHSGIKLKFPFYSTLNHHIHHKYPNKNYGSGFPILVWDKLFGTYQNHL